MKTAGLRLFFGVRAFFVSTAEKIINADFIKISKRMQGADWNVQASKFIIGICGLVDTQKCCQFFL